MKNETTELSGMGNNPRETQAWWKIRIQDRRSIAIQSKEKETREKNRNPMTALGNETAFVLSPFLSDSLLPLADLTEMKDQEEG